MTPISHFRELRGALGQVFAELHSSCWKCHIQMLYFEIFFSFFTLFSEDLDLRKLMLLQLVLTHIFLILIFIMQ